jgi:hypothetical protein
MGWSGFVDREGFAGMDGSLWGGHGLLGLAKIDTHHQSYLSTATPQLATV